MNIGIDKIALTTPEFQANNLDKYTISTIKKPNEDVPFLLRDKKGIEHFGNRAFLQTESAIIDINQKGLLIAFNPSKAKHPYKLSDSLGAITEKIKQETLDSGIDLDIETMNVTRLDLTKQAEMKQPVHVYNDVFNYLRGKRLVSKQYPSGFSFGNKSSEGVFYDKRAEMEFKHKLKLSERNFMRAEIKYKKRKTVITETGLVNYQALLEIETEKLTESYNSYLSKRIFNKMNLGEQLELDFYGEADILRGYLEMYPRGGTMKYLMDLGLDTALELFGSLEGFKKLLEAVNMPIRTIYRTIADLNKQVQRKAKLDTKRGVETVASRLYEVQETFTIN